MRATGVAAVSARFGRDLDACFELIERTVLRARAQGAGLVVFPECALGGYLHEGPTPQAPPPALERDGPEIARLMRIAGPTVVCAGYTEAAPDGPYSSAVCLSGAGVHGHHRKVHLPAGERGFFGAGDRFTAFDTPVGRMGMLVCYDKCFPEAARSLALDGAELVAALAAWPVCRRDPARRLAADRQTRQFNLLDEARAVENQVVWVSANQAGALGPLRFVGHAKVVDPEGTVLARTGGRAGLAVARVDAAERVGLARRALSHLEDRRPGAYLAAPGGPLAGASGLVPAG